MADSVDRTSALKACFETGLFGAGTDGQNPGVTLTERRPLSVVHVAGKSDDAAFLKGVRQVCGCDLPMEAGTVAIADDLSVIWLAPTRWLVVAPDRGPSVLEEALRAACGDTAAITDVSHGRTVIRLSGPAVRTVLMKGAPLDFHPAVFTPGRALQSTVSQCGALMVCVDDDTVDVYVFRAFGRHIWEWITDASGEFGYRVVEPVAD